MVDLDLQNIPQSSHSGTVAEVYYTYTPEQQAARDDLIRLIELIKRDYIERIEPYLKRLSAIQGTPHLIIKNLEWSER